MAVFRPAKHASSEIAAALHALPIGDLSSSMREGRVLMPTKGLMRSEMDAVKRALKAPREKADTVSFVASVLTLLISAVKAFWGLATSAGGPNVSWSDLAMLLLSVAVIPLITAKYIAQRTKRSEIHELALGYVNELFPDEDPPAAPPGLPAPTDPSK